MTSQQRIRNIQQRIEAGESLQEIADDFGISPQRVSQLLKPRTDRKAVRAKLGVDNVLLMPLHKAAKAGGQ